MAAELVVLGTGYKVERLDPSIGKFLKRKGISLEIQDTVRISGCDLHVLLCCPIVAKCMRHFQLSA